MNKIFEFRGSGLGYFWLLTWTSVLALITFGLFFPWSFSAQQRWIASNTYVNNRQLVFNGTGLAFLSHWIVIVILLIITFGIYIPWAYCQVKRWEVENTDFADNIGITSNSQRSQITQ